MATSILTEDILRQIGTVKLQRYAVSRGWQRQILPDRFQMALYRRPEDPSKELILPQNEDFGDYYSRLNSFIEGLAEQENLTVRQILNSLLNPNADVLRFGYEAPESKLGFVPFLTGISLFDAALRSISTATYDVIRPERFHARMSNPTADEYIASCRMGQTEHGSFVVSCICPVEQPDQPLLREEEVIVDETPALGRKVTTQIIKSVSQIREFVLADQVDRLVNPEANDIQISANFFESLMAFPVEHEAASLYITATWDKAMEEPDIPRRAEVRFDMFEAIEEVARQLRPTRTTREDKFIAKVINLRGEPNSEEQMEGEVVLLLLHQDSGVRAKIWLGPEDYALAGEAHLQNRYVSVTGTFSKLRKTNRIDQYTAFSILSD